MNHPAGIRQKVTQIRGHLNQRRLGDADIERVLEMLVQHVKNRPRKAPKEEERRDEHEWDDVLLVRKAGFVHRSM